MRLSSLCILNIEGSPNFYVGTRIITPPQFLSGCFSDASAQAEARTDTCDGKT